MNTLVFYKPSRMGKNRNKKGEKIMIYFIFGMCLILGAILSIKREDWDGLLYMIAMIVFFIFLPL